MLTSEPVPELHRGATWHSSGDADMHKGVIEDDHPYLRSNAPGLDDDGLPNDEIAIAEDAIGAREDRSQG